MRILLAIISIVFPSGIATCQNSYQPGGRANLLPTRVSNATPIPEPSWVAEYLTGSQPLDKGSWVRIAFVPQSATFEKKNLVFTVPADKIVSIEYSVAAERDSNRQGPRSGCGYARGMMPNRAKNQPEDMIGMRVARGRASLLTERLLRHYPIRINWIGENAQQQVSLGANNCEYGALIANLRWLLGTRWNEVARDTAR